MELLWGGGTWAGWGCHGMVAHEQRVQGTVALERMEISWGGGTREDGGVRFGTWAKMETPWEVGTSSGWRRCGMVMNERDGDLQGWGHRGRGEISWDGGTWKDGGIEGMVVDVHRRAGGRCSEMVAQGQGGDDVGWRHADRMEQFSNGDTGKDGGIHGMVAHG